MQLLPLDDPRWQTYRSGYNRKPFDVSPLARRLLAADADESLWNILWEDLHHQGDVGEASYAIVPYLTAYAAQAPNVPWHVYGFPATVELERFSHHNPPLPPELDLSYHWALQELPRIAVRQPPGSWDDSVFPCAAACFALSRGHRLLARAYIELTAVEARTFLTNLNGYEPDERD